MNDRFCRVHHIVDKLCQQALAGSVLICDSDLEICNLHLGVKDSGKEAGTSGSQLFELQVATSEMPLNSFERSLAACHKQN
jgi:hypothetical protein